MRRNSFLLVPLLSLLLHAYIGVRLLPALQLSTAGLAISGALLLFCALLMPAPLLIRLNRLPGRTGDALAWAGYLAMGVFSTLFVLTLLRDLVLLPLALWNVWHPLELGAWKRASAFAVLALTALVSLVGLFNARRTARVVQVDVPIAGLPAALSGFRIAQLSDVHVGPTIKRGYLEAIVRRVNALDADLVALTGDIVDGSVEALREHVQPLATLRSRHGSYCVTGNHEYYHGAHGWVREWRSLGLRVLLNANEVIEHGGARLLVGGVTDYSAGHFDEQHRSDPLAAARSAQKVDARLLLAHQPRSAKAAAEAGFDLQISGHTHGGQFLPWNFFVPLQQPFVAGLARLGKLWVYTSRGTGYWGPPLRFGAPSEITLLRLVTAR